MINTYDKLYNDLVSDILENGVMDDASKVRTKYEDGSPAPAKSLFSRQIRFDNSKVNPLLTTKLTPRKDPIIELFWIWQKMSNDVKLLNEMGSTVWDEWENEEGNIGKAYGWQLANKSQKVDVDQLFIDMYFNNEFSFGIFGKDLEDGIQVVKSRILKNDEIFTVDLNQVDYLLYSLKKNPYSRRLTTTLWCVEDLQEMQLPPCVYESRWVLLNGVLNLKVKARSTDIALGSVYNIYQYSMLHRMIAQVTGHKVGEFVFDMDIPHIYDRHLETISEQIKGQTHEQPDIWINPEIKSFYDFTTNDIKVNNYTHNGKFSYEIAI